MNVQNYSYQSPDREWGNGGEFRVDVVDPSSPYMGRIATSFQEVMLETWTEQFKSIFTEDQIRRTVNPDDFAKGVQQADRLRGGGQGPDQALYVRATIELPEPDNGLGLPDHIIIAAIGKALEVKQKLWKPTLADISNLFVRPRTPVLELQGRGIGSATLRSMLDHFPDDMPAVIYDFPFNERTVQWLAGLGFNVKIDKTNTWQEEYFGEQVNQTKFDGPAVGELKEKLETKRPWLRDRTPMVD